MDSPGNTDAAANQVPDFGRDLSVGVDGAVGRLTLDRPEKLNPLSVEVLEGIEAAARWFDSLRGLKVVVVSGEGRSFSAGADIAGFVGAPEDDRSTRERADAGRRMADALEACRAVTVARIQGHCIGGGVVLASACDFRVATSDAHFSIPEVDLGIPLAWGGVPRLIREIGAPATRDLVMTCRPFGAAEAARLGFLQRVVDPEDLDDAVEQLVSTLAGKAALPLLSTKSHVNAVTAQMTGLARSWGEADGLVTALSDPESRDAAARYLEGLAGR
jgi:enoyl-CoA hydratase/carnithine racemase